MICDREVETDCDNKLQLGFMGPIPHGERAGVEFGTGRSVSSRANNDRGIEAGRETAWPRGFTLSLFHVDHTASKVRVTRTLSTHIYTRANGHTSGPKFSTSDKN